MQVISIGVVQVDGFELETEPRRVALPTRGTPPPVPAGSDQFNRPCVPETLMLIGQRVTYSPMSLSSTSPRHSVRGTVQ